MFPASTEHAASLVEHMKATSGSAYCERCVLDGIVFTVNLDGSPIDESKNRCPGCGRLICDRHPMEASVESRDVKHRVVNHLAAPKEPASV